MPETKLQKLEPPKTIEEGLKRMYYYPGHQGASFSLEFLGSGSWRVMSMNGEIFIAHGRTAMSAIRAACKEERV